MQNINLKKLVEQNQIASMPVKKLFLQFWQILKNEDRITLEKALVEKPYLIDKMLTIFEKKKHAIENQMSGVFDEILEEEKKLLLEV